MKRIHRIAALVVFLFMAGNLFAQTITIKLGSLVPYGSPWEEELQKLSLEWSKISGGKIKLKIYPGGIAGGEDDMVRKIRQNALQAAALTGPGLSDIFGGVLALQIPLLVRSEAELDHLLETMGPALIAEIEKKGFKLLFWNMVGWAHIFSRDPVVYPEDMQKQKMWVMAGNDDEATAWKKMGFRVFVLSTADVTVQLQSGGIDTMVTSPLVAVASRWYENVKNMAAFKFAPFIGGVIIPTKIWDRIPQDLQRQLEDAANEVSTRMRGLTNRANEEAVSAMERQGLVVNEIPEDAVLAWQEIVEDGIMEFVGDKFDVRYYEEAKRILEAYRKVHGR
jgi:TRAP-type C4-dicarboxylate transport system substrate-binding protein